MSKEEKFKNYKEEHCKRCKNKKKDLCNITIVTNNKSIKARCCYFEEEKKRSIIAIA